MARRDTCVCSCSDGLAGGIANGNERPQQIRKHRNVCENKQIPTKAFSYFRGCVEGGALGKGRARPPAARIERRRVEGGGSRGGNGLARGRPRSRGRGRKRKRERKSEASSGHKNGPALMSVAEKKKRKRGEGKKALGGWLYKRARARAIFSESRKERGSAGIFRKEDIGLKRTSSSSSSFSFTCRCPSGSSSGCPRRRSWRP